MNPLHPEDAGELWPQLRTESNKNARPKRMPPSFREQFVSLSSFCAHFFGYVYLFFEDRLFEYFEKLPMVKQFLILCAITF